MKADVPGKTGSGIGEVALAPVRLAMGLIDAPLRWLQRVAGISGMAAFFLLPNMLIFGIFVLLPFFINFAYSMTGSTALFLPDRTFVGARAIRPALRLPQLSRSQQLRRRHVLDGRRQYRLVRRHPGHPDDRRLARHGA